MSDEIDRRIGDFLAETLKEAGVTPEFVTRAVKRTSEALDATKIQRIHTGGGEITEYKKDPDHAIRLAAVTRALDLGERAGLVPGPLISRTGPPGGATIQVNVVVLRPDGTESVVQLQAPTAKIIDQSENENDSRGPNKMSSAK